MTNKFKHLISSITLISGSAQLMGSHMPPGHFCLKQYPKTVTHNSSEIHYGQEVKDPFRWLENNQSEAVANWTDEQNNLTFSYLKDIPYRSKIKNRLRALWNYETAGAPFIEGPYIWYFKNNGLQNHSVLYRIDQNQNHEIFLDPNQFSEDGTTSLDQTGFSEDGSLLAYSISENGSDWRKIIVVHTKTGIKTEKPLDNIKFSGISWHKNTGFYYSSYRKPEGSELSTKTDQHLLYFHKAGDDQANDQVIFGDAPDQKYRYIHGSVSENQRFLTISAANSTSGNLLLIKDLENQDSEVISVTKQMDSDTWLVDSQGDHLYFMTNLNAPNYRLIKTTIQNPSPETWEDIISESEHVLSVSTGGGALFSHYMRDAASQVFHYDHSGNVIGEILLPETGTISTPSGKYSDQDLYFHFTNYKTSSSIYRYNLKSKKTTLYRKSKCQFNGDLYETYQVFYRSKDGTKVPMTITHKKGLTLDGQNPTILYGYGGFNISLTPSFSVANAVWLEMGGVYAVPNIRGGGEYGKEWHQSGTKLNKQNVFDDFIAAGQYLQNKGYTSSEFLALKGGSNGGLLVGAVINQCPQLASVALPAVGVLDMLRYHKFTAGAGWAEDYGTPEDSEEMFRYLHGYSPVHNVIQNGSYPATLITTADHDDRVVPAHSYKFAASLQASVSKESGPALIRIEKNSGHGAGMSLSKQIQLQADLMSFTLYNMGILELEEPDMK